MENTINRKDYRRIGEGTNRFVCLLDNHIIKVAYNYLAYIDNMNELAQAKDKPKYLAKAFETNGLILVSEYVTVMDNIEFLECQNEIKTILSENSRLKAEVRTLKSQIEIASQSKGVTNVDILKRLSELEKVVYGE